MSGTDLICVAEIAGTHGVRGLVRLRSFTADPLAVTGYGPLTDATGQRVFQIVRLVPHGAMLLAELDGVTSKEQAASLGGTRLHIPRARLPQTGDEDSFYHADLIGLRVEDGDGGVIGTVRAVHDFGAGDLLEILRADGGSVPVMLPFTRAVVPVVDIAGGRLVADPPAGLLDPVKPVAEAAE